LGSCNYPLGSFVLGLTPPFCFIRNTLTRRFLSCSNSRQFSIEPPRARVFFSLGFRAFSGHFPPYFFLENTTKPPTRSLFVPLVLCLRKFLESFSRFFPPPLADTNTSRWLILPLLSFLVRFQGVGRWKYSPLSLAPPIARKYWFLNPLPGVLLSAPLRVKTIFSLDC